MNGESGWLDVSLTSLRKLDTIVKGAKNEKNLEAFWPCKNCIGHKGSIFRIEKESKNKHFDCKLGDPTN